MCHYNKLFERKKSFLKQFEIFDITNYSIIDNYDIENWDLKEILNEYPNILNITKRQNRRLKFSEISLLLKHCFIIKDAYEKKYESILILEDDVLLCNNFTILLDNYIKQLPTDWDILWTGTCCDLHANKNSIENVYKMNGSRCTHSFVVSKNCIEKIINEIKYADRESDWYYNFLIEKFNLNNYWAEPALAYQSSEFKSTIQD